jgi:hypothetical protein
MKIKVPVKFEGVIEVDVSPSLNQTESRCLAEKLALAKVIATTQNPDAPEEEALDDFIHSLESSNLTTDDIIKAWDNANVGGVSGSWTVGSGPSARNINRD